MLGNASTQHQSAVLPQRSARREARANWRATGGHAGVPGCLDGRAHGSRDGHPIRSAVGPEDHPIDRPPRLRQDAAGSLGRFAVALLSGQKCQFMVVKPGEWVSKYVGQTEENIRSCFQSLGAAAAEGYVVLFLDEVESIGLRRATRLAITATNS